MKRALLVCPGRGSYDRTSLGGMMGRGAAAAAIVAACDAHRAARGEPTVTELDADPAFRAARHVAGEHASLLTFAVTAADAADLDRSLFEVVGVVGNSMGWYTALAVSGALPLGDAIRLVDTMGAYQRDNVIGGQVLYPTSGEDWVEDPVLVRSVDEGIARVRAAGRIADWSIRLGGFAVLGADGDGVKQLLAELPPVARRDRTFPVQLPLHSAFHTELLAETSARAREDLADLAFRAPDVPLVDGRGRIYRPRTADPAELAEYTLGHQVVRPYDFVTSVVTALHHVGPDVVIALGPGNPLGGPLARILVGDGWRGSRSRAAFDAATRESPALRSFGVPAQRSEIVAT